MLKVRGQKGTIRYRSKHTLNSRPIAPICGSTNLQFEFRILGAEVEAADPQGSTTYMGVAFEGNPVGLQVRTCVSVILNTVVGWKGLGRGKHAVCIMHHPGRTGTKVDSSEWKVTDPIQHRSTTYTAPHPAHAATATVLARPLTHLHIWVAAHAAEQHHDLQHPPGCVCVRVCVCVCVAQTVRDGVRTCRCERARVISSMISSTHPMCVCVCVWGGGHGKSTRT